MHTQQTTKPDKFMMKERTVEESLRRQMEELRAKYRPSLKLYEIVEIPTTLKKGITPMFPFGRTTFLNRVKAEIYPKPLKAANSRDNYYDRDALLEAHFNMMLNDQTDSQ